MAQFIDKLNQLEAAKAKVAELEKSVLSERELALASLPHDFGFGNLNDFIKALKAASAKSGKGKGRKGAKAVKAPKAAKAPKGAKAAKAAKSGKRTRTKITPELKAQVIAAVQEGKSGAEISKATGISLPSVQNIKKEAGLVKARAAVEAAPAPAPAPEQQG
ncbi:MAG: helix-turn-helix domain-containing protein [Verrucomicrobiota bacterium]